MANFTRGIESLKIGILMGSFNPKLSRQWRMTQNLKRKWLVISKLTWRIWQILIWALERLKNSYFNVFLLRKVYIVSTKQLHRTYLSWNWRGINFHFNGLLLSKLYIVWAKKVQRSYLSGHWRVIQNVERNRLVV